MVTNKRSQIRSGAFRFGKKLSHRQILQEDIDRENIHTKKTELKNQTYPGISDNETIINRGTKERRRRGHKLCQW
jgi:hypothetical protein